MYNDGDVGLTEFQVIECMRKVTVCCFLRFQTSWTGSKKSIVTVSKSCHHTNRHMEPYIRFAFFTLCQLQPVLIPPTTMDNLPYRKTSRETGIRTRFKSLTSIEQTKLSFLKKCALINFARYKREIHPQKRALLKKRILVFLAMSIGIKADTYEEVEPPIRSGISLENMTDMFSKEFLRFRKENIRR